MIKTTLTIEKTTIENASKSWENNVYEMIAKYPYHATLTRLGGGFFKNIPTIADINSGFAKSHPCIKYSANYEPNKLGKWEVEMYTKKETNHLIVE